MGLGIAAIQNILELNNLGYLKNAKNIIEMGSQEIHITKEDLKELFEIAGLEKNLIEKFPNVKNWPFNPKCSSKYLFKSLGIDKYESIDLNGEHGSIIHDLNKPFEDKSKFNTFDIVTDYGSCEHVFNITECYKTVHNLAKSGGYIIIAQGTLKGNGYFKFDECFIEGIAAANNYNVIYSSYLIKPGIKTSNGSFSEFHIPRNQTMLNCIDQSKFQGEFGTPKEIGIYCVLQKTSENEFKMPYQGDIVKDIYNIAGFNRAYMKDDMSYNYIPSSTTKLEDASLAVIIKVLIKSFKNSIKKVIRVLIMKIK